MLLNNNLGMQNYLYDKSLNLFFSYKGKNSHVPTLSNSNTLICLLGSSFRLEHQKRKEELECTPLMQLSKSEPPMMTKTLKEEPPQGKIHVLDYYLLSRFFWIF